MRRTPMKRSAWPRRPERAEPTERQPATIHPATPSVGAYTITVNESDLGRMSAAEIAARINDHYFKG